MTMSMVDLQRRLVGPRADELLDQLQRALGGDERVQWDDTGHARIPLGRERDDAREEISARLNELGDDWTDHIAIL